MPRRRPMPNQPAPTVRTDVRQGAMLSSEEVTPTGHGQEIPLEALHTPPPEIEVPGIASLQDDTLALERFMEEKVTIQVHVSNDEGELPYVEPKVNGAGCVIPRGRTVIVKRKFVEALANAKQTNYHQQVVTPDSQTIETALVANVGLIYPFTLIDDTQKGKAWLRDKLRTA